MTISDETLMAYADGELDAAARAAVESAMREDPNSRKTFRSVCWRRPEASRAHGARW